MKMIIWKELRENYKWALIGMGIILWSFWTSLPNMRERADFPHWSFEQANWTSALAIGMAFVLAMLQMMPERKTDRWAFLVHRPMTLRELFHGKCIAGLLLMGVVIGIPTMGMLIWTRVPGNVALPFMWETTWQYFYLTSLFIPIFYLSGLMVAIREARWWVSRLAPVAGAILLMTRLNKGHQIGLEKIFLAGLGLTLFWKGAKESFIADGKYGQMGKFGRITVGVGVMTLMWVVLLFAGALIPFGKTKEREKRNPEYKIDANGVPVIFSEGKNDAVRALDGRVLASTPEEIDDLEFLDSEEIERWRNRRRGRGFSIPEQTYDSIEVRDKEMAWVYLYPYGKIYGYSRYEQHGQSFEWVSEISPDGFGKPGTSRSRFPENLTHDWRRQLEEGFLFAFESEIYQINFKSKKVERIGVLEPQEKIELSYHWYRGREDNVTALATDRRLLFLKKDGTIQTQVPRQKPLSDFRFFKIHSSDKKPFFVLEQSHGCDPHCGENCSRSETVYFFKYDFSGKLLAEYKAPRLPECAMEHSLLRQIGEGITNMSLLYYGDDLYKRLLAKLGVEEGLYHLYWIKKNPEGYKEKGVISIGWGVIAALMALAVARRNSFSIRKTAEWALIVFGTGIPGFLMFLALRDWPAQAVCAACGKKRPVNLDSCPNCKATWPEKSPDGTEVLIPAVK